MSVLLDILGGGALTGAVGRIMLRPMTAPPNRRRYLGIDLEELILGLVTVIGTLMFLAAQLI